MNPKHTHDCDDCQFLGTLSGPNPYHAGKRYDWDLYHCPRADSDMGGSIIARYGSDGPEYQSSPIALIKRYLEERHMMHPVMHWALALLEEK